MEIMFPRRWHATGMLPRWKETPFGHRLDVETFCPYGFHGETFRLHGGDEGTFYKMLPRHCHALHRSDGETFLRNVPPWVGHGEKGFSFSERSRVCARELPGGRGGGRHLSELNK